MRVLGACAWGGNRRARVDADSDGRSGREKREGLEQQVEVAMKRREEEGKGT